MYFIYLRIFLRLLMDTSDEMISTVQCRMYAWRFSESSRRQFCITDTGQAMSTRLIVLDFISPVNSAVTCSVFPRPISKYKVILLLKLFFKMTLLYTLTISKDCSLMMIVNMKHPSDSFQLVSKQLVYKSDGHHSFEIVPFLLRCFGIVRFRSDCGHFCSCRNGN